MASPTVTGTPVTLTGESATGTNHTITLDGAASASELMLGFFATDGNETITWPNTGPDNIWVKIGTDSLGSGSTSTLSVAYHIVTGSEPTTITVTTGTNEKANAVIYRIPDAEAPGTQAPERSTGQSGSGLNNANSDTITPTGGSKDYLFFSFMSLDSDGAVTAAPTNYSNLQTANSTGAGSNSIGVAQRALTAASDDAGAFTHPSEEWGAVGVAVHPTSGGATTGVGSAAGTSTATAVGRSTARSVGASTGTSTATAVGRSIFRAVGTAAGTSTASGVSPGATTVTGVGASAGTSTATAVGRSTHRSVGTSAGTSTALAVSTFVPDIWTPTTSSSDTWTPTAPASDVWTNL